MNYCNEVKVMILLDFDGTLVKENSSRLLEKVLINSIQNSFLKKLFMVLLFSGASLVINVGFVFLTRLCHGADVRRRFLLYLLPKLQRDINMINAAKLVAKMLTLNINLMKLANELTKDYGKDVIIVSSAMDVIIEEFISAKIKDIYKNNLNIVAVYATRTAVKGKLIRIVSEFTCKDKTKVISDLSGKYSKIAYVTDDIRELKELRTLGFKILRNDVDLFIATRG